ncbi:MAG TPA: hypothetical protein VFM46_10295, partial [Pseudomonadales bacterium]|nr:hypothetical protein [Pseudomonadales bacterium]
MYTNVTPSPPTGVGLNRVDGVKPSMKEVSEQTAKGEFSQALSSSRAPSVKFDDARAIQETMKAKAQQSVSSAP